MKRKQEIGVAELSLKEQIRRETIKELSKDLRKEYDMKIKNEKELILSEMKEE